MNNKITKKLILLAILIWVTASYAETLSDISCGQPSVEDKNLILSVIEKLDGTKLFLEKIPNDKIAILESLDKANWVEIRKSGWSSEKTHDSFKKLFDADFYAQWKYLKELEGVKNELNRVITAENYSDEFKANMNKHAYFSKFKNQKHAIQLYFAIQANAKYTRFMDEMFGRSVIQPNVFKNEDYGKHGLKLDASRELMDEYMLCKIARSIDKQI